MAHWGGVPLAGARREFGVAMAALVPCTGAEQPLPLVAGSSGGAAAFSADFGRFCRPEDAERTPNSEPA